MGQIIVGIAFLIFGLTIGGIGLATAGIGVGVPMIPLGIYFFIRGFRSFLGKKKEENKTITDIPKQKVFERTRLGRLCLGIILILVGMATSALLIDIPIVIIGAVLIISIFLGKGTCYNKKDEPEYQPKEEVHKNER